MIKKQHIHIFSLLLGTVAVIATVILNISSPTNAASWVLDGGNVTWDNSNFIDASFWNDNPSTGDIIKALYGSGVGDTTAYTTNWSGRNTAQCSGSDMTVIETGNLPATLSANTIYVLTGEQAIVSSKINLANCSAIVSKNISGTTLYSAEYLGTSITLLNINKKKHTIIDHINVDGTNDGNGSNHTGNDYGAYYFNSSSNNTINNAQFYNNNYYGIFIWSTLYTSVSNSQLYNNNSAGIRVYSSSNNFINDSQFYDNNDGITLEGSSTNNSINDSQFYTNYGDGILINSGANNSIDNIQVYNNELNGIIISSGTNNTINNSQTYNNNQYGIRILLSSNNSINNIQAYNNEFDGIRIDSGSNNSINNSQSYNNYGGGIIIYNFSSNNTINNSQLYNNYSDGIRISSSSNNTINNSQSYNNNGNGIWFSLTTNNTINNAQCYNNYINGIYFNDSSNNIINNFQGYNNRNNGFSSSVNSTGNLYYGKVSLFANGIPGIGQASGNFSTGYANDQPVQSLGRATGELITTGTMSWDYITNPLNTVGDYLLSWSDSWTSLRSTKLSYSGTVTDKYSFGSGILLQTQPVIWSGTTDLISSGSFDPTKYIGSDVVKVTGELLGLPAMTSGLNFTVTGNSSDNLVNNYSLFGNISSSEYNIPGTSTEITFTAGDGEKRIVTQLFGAIYFATHFETTTILDTMIPNQVQLFSPYSGEVFATGNITGLFRYPLVDVGSPLQYCHRGYLNAVDIGGDCDNDTGYFISFDLPDGIYTRNVYAKDAFGNTGAVSETRGFTIDATPPSQVTLISPSSGNSLTTGDVPLVRSSAIDTGVGISGYYFEIVGTNYSGFLIQTGTTITGITDGNYQWHVYAIDTIGNTGSRSETRGFTVDSTVCSNTRNNDNFITGAFWNTNPADKCIIEALYGTTGDTNTAYTNYRSGYTSGTCLSSMSVTGVSNLPATLSANTIYVLTGEQAIVPTTRNLNNCSAVISKNISGTTFFSTGSLFSSFTTSNKRDVIIDNIILDGRNDGLGLSHDSNSYGVYILNSSNTTVVHVQSYNNGNGIGLEIAKNNTIAHTQAYRNDNVGIYLQGNSNNNTIVDNLAYSNLDGIYITMSSNGNIVDNISSYNNTNNGIKLNSSSNNTINNSQTYNNSSIGVYLQSSSNNAINNFQSYNNTKDGIKIESSSNYNLIKNTQIYNNSIRGIELLASTNNIINNVMIFNNYNYAIYLDAYATGNIYYGDLTFFANFNSGVGGTSGNLSTGYANDALVQGLGRTTGNIITTGTMSWDLITNPLNTSGNYLLPWSGDWTSIGGHKSTYSGSLTQAYSFGSGIFTQVQPVIWSGTTELINSGTFNPTQYIGSNTTKLTGSLSGTIPTRTNSTGIYTVQPLASIATGYTLFGNILGTPYNNTIGISTGIKLTTGDGQKNIITQIYGSFATHFQTTTILDQTPPSFEFPSRGGNECITSAYLTIASATPAIDTGVGLSSIPYSFDGITWTGNATINIATQQPGTQTRTGRVRDDLGNSSYKVSIFTFYDALPIASNFTGSSNVSSTSKTADWITQSIIQEGSCGNTDISYSGMVTQATKGVCNVSGNDITYTPNLNQTGTDSCTMQAKDNENNTVNIIVYRENIDTIVLYCGDGIVQTPNRSGNNEQCDLGSENGPNSACSSECTWNMPICTIEPISKTIYSGAELIITGTAISGARFTDINFGLPDELFSINQTGIYITGHTYNNGGIFVITGIVDNPLSGNMVNFCTGMVTVQYCGDGDVNGSEQCDGEIGCSNSCIRELVSCFLEVSSPIYSGQLAIITGTVNPSRTIVSGFNFGLPNYSYSIGLSGNYSTGHTYNSGGIYQVTMDVVHPGSGDITDSCTGSIEVQYCGDGDVNGTEQCDGEIGCSTSCTREAVSCSLNLPASIYSGSTTTITGTVNHTRTIVSGFNFGPPNYSYSIGLSGNYSTGHIYNSGGVFEIIMDVVHPGSGDITASCTGSIQVQYCGDGIMNGSEDCDGGIGCSSSCTLIPPTNTDCTLPWGGTIVSGASVTAYQSVSVACGTSCVSQTRTCLSGTLSGTFTQQTCGVQTCGGTTTIIGGGGSTIIPRDDCTLPSNVACANAEGLDNSPSYYDNSCCGTSVSTGGTHGAASTCDVSDSPYSSEITDAFSWAYGINITDKCPITRARLDSKITRIEAAKMMSMFTIQIIGLTPNTSKKGCDKFSDLGSVSDEMKFFAKTACQLDIMGLEPDGKTPKKKFDPKDLIDRAQFGTMLSRLVYGDVYNLSSREKKTIARYQKHLEALGKDNIIQKAPNPWIQENRSRVMIMLKRTQDQGLVEKYHLVAPAHNGASALFDNVW